VVVALRRRLDEDAALVLAHAVLLGLLHHDCSATRKHIAAAIAHEERRKERETGRERLESATVDIIPAI